MNKNFLCTLILLFLCTICLFSQRPVHKFIDKHNDYHNSVAMTIPGWLIRSGTNFAEKFAEDEDEKVFLSLGQYIKKVRFLAIDGDSPIDNEDIQWLLAGIKKTNLEEYVTVRDQDKNVNVWIEDDNNIVKNLTMLARTEDGFALVTIKSKLPLEILKKADFSFNKHL